MKYKVECNNCNSTELEQTEYIQGRGVGFKCLDCGNEMPLRNIEFREINEEGETVMELTIENLEECFNRAYEERMSYVGVKILMAGFEGAEIIVNPFENIKEKLAYYKKSYNENLTLKAFDGIKIIGFTFGDKFEDIENDLVF